MTTIWPSDTPQCFMLDSEEMSLVYWCMKVVAEEALQNPEWEDGKLIAAVFCRMAHGFYEPTKPELIQWYIALRRATWHRDADIGKILDLNLKIDELLCYWYGDL